MGKASKNSVTRNSIYNLISQLITLLFPMIIILYISRILGPENIGKYNFVKSLANYFIIVAGLGIPFYANREISKVKEDKTQRSKIFIEIQTLRLISVAICYLIFIFLIFIWPDIVKGNTTLGYLLASLVFLSLFRIEWYFQGLEAFGVISKYLLFSRTLQLISVFIFVNDSRDLLYYVLIVIFTEVIFDSMLLYKAKQSISFSVLRGQTLLLHSHLKFIGWFFFAQLSIMVYTNLDSVMIGYMQDEKKVGYYFVANKLVRIIITVITSLGLVLFTRISSLKEEGKIEKIKDYLSKSLSLVFILTIPATIGLILLSKQIISILFGSQYDSVLTLIILAPLTIVIGLSNVYGTQILLSFGEEKKFSLIIISAALVNYVLNMFLINKIGHNGAALSTLIAESFIMFFDYILIRKMVPGIHDIENIFQVILASLIMTIFIIYTRDLFFLKFGNLITLFAIMLSSSLIYVGILYILNNKMLKWLIHNKLKKIF